jgi:hypothetical protein
MILPEVSARLTQLHPSGCHSAQSCNAPHPGGCSGRARFAKGDCFDTRVREAPGGTTNPSTPVAAGRRRQALRAQSRPRRAAERHACVASGTAPEHPAAMACAVAAHRPARGVGLRRERRRRTCQREAGHARGWSEWPPARMACATRARRESVPPRASRFNTRKSPAPTSRNSSRARVSQAAYADVQHPDSCRPRPL